MATYYPSSSSQQRDISTTPFVASHKLDSYCGSPHLSDGMIYRSQASTNESYLALLSGKAFFQQNCDGVPTVGGGGVVFMPLAGGLASPPPVGQQVNMIANFSDNEERDMQYQGLALSLGVKLPSSVQLPSVEYHFGIPGPSYVLNSPIQGSGHVGSQSDESKVCELLSFGLAGGKDNRTSIGKFNSPSIPREVQYTPQLYEESRFGFAFSNSKYLKGAQQLLDEVVNVYESLKQPKVNSQKFGLDGCEGSNVTMISDAVQPSTNGLSSDRHDSATKSSSEFSNAERLDLHSKQMELFSLLNEVDTRYKQYYHQMRILESSFQMMAGPGSAKRYTALALQTISRQFRCLRDATNKQIQVNRLASGEQVDTLNSPVLPRLRYVDKHLRQQRTIQQLGVAQHSWRPQKGLPERAVSVLRAWLFEHFLNPYPKDSEKSMLARKTGLTRSQVANWFINARVRLWKPMVEDMYKDEFGNSETDKMEELKESGISAVTGGGYLENYSDLKTDRSCNGNGGDTVRLGFNNGSHGDGSIDGRPVTTFPGENWQNDDHHHISPHNFVKPNQTGEGNLKAIDTSYNSSNFGDFAGGNQVLDFALQC